MTSIIFSVVSIVFVILALGIGAISAVHVRRNRAELEKVFGEKMWSDTTKLRKEAAECDRQTDEELKTMGATKVKRLTFSDITH